MADFLDYMVEDPHTHAVMLFCEAVRNGPGFVAALDKARRLGKPVIAIKVGRSDAGTRASASHTASLSGSHAAYHAVFERYGVIEAEDADEAVAIAGVVLTCPLPKGRRAGIVTVSGGGGAWMADTLSAHGLIVPQLSAEAQAALRPLMPSYGASGNPVDVTAQGSNTGPAMMTVMEHLAQSDEIDMVVLVTSLASETRASLDAGAGPGRGGELRQADDGVELYAALGVRAGIGRRLRPVRAQRPAQRRRCRWASWPAMPRRCSAACRNRSSRSPAGCIPGLPRGGAGVSGEAGAGGVAAAMRGKPWCDRAEEAAEAAERLGFPVVLKVQSPDLPHKTEAGGVRLHLADRAAVSAAYDGDAGGCGAPSSRRRRIDGVLVQRMAPKGHELVIGMVDDPTFGPIMMLGFGGTTVELFGDVVHAPAPIDEAEATRMILSLQFSPFVDRVSRLAGRSIWQPVAALVASLSRAALDAARPGAGVRVEPGHCPRRRLRPDGGRRTADDEGIKPC